MHRYTEKDKLEELNSASKDKVASKDVVINKDNIDETIIDGKKHIWCFPKNAWVQSED